METGGRRRQEPRRVLLPEGQPLRAARWKSEAFRDLHARFRKAGTEIVGVSPDSVASHDKFIAKYGFTFALLADEEKAVCELFGVWKEKSMYGKKYMGVERSTFLIDAKGVLRREWRKVKVPGHAEEVLAAAAGL